MENIEQLVETLSRDAARPQPAPHPFMLSLKWLALAAGYLSVSLAISGLRPDLPQKFLDPVFAAEIAALLGLLVATALSGALLVFPDLHQKRGIAFAPVWMFGLFLLAMSFAWRADDPPAPLPMHSFECTLGILMLSLLPIVAIFFSMRKFASTHHRSSGAVAMLFAFGIGALWLRLYEPNDSIMHVIEWHYLPMAGFGAAGLWLGKRLLKW